MRQFALVIATLAALLALGWLLVRGDPPAVRRLPEAPVVPIRTPDPEPTGPEGLLPTPTPGGVVAGIVIDVNDRPMQGVRVLLVRYDAGDEEEFQRYEDQYTRDGYPDLTLVPTIGDFELAGEKLTDAEGRFTLAGDRRHYISHVVAYTQGHFPKVVDLRESPIAADGTREPVLVRLEAGGRLLGNVVDDATGDSVARAHVTIDLQQPTRPIALLEDGSLPSEERGTDAPAPAKSAMATLGSFISRVLGERVWGLKFGGSHDGSLELMTDENGNFEFGPLAEDVQVNFTVTHPEYIWSDFDNPDGKTQPVRARVRTGETVHKTLRLQRGGEVGGKVVDKVTGDGVSGVLIEVRSLSAYFRHPWYRSKARMGLTDDEGRFHVRGLARGSQGIVAKHVTFGKSDNITVEPGEMNVIVPIEMFGGMMGRVEGADERPPGGRVSVMLEYEMMGTFAAATTRTATLDSAGGFVLTQLKPGRYRMWLQAGKAAALPRMVEIEPHGVHTETFILGEGGRFELAMRAESGRAIETASAVLYRVHDGGEERHGSFVSREGKIEGDTILPGRYVLEVSAVNHVAMRTEPFDLVAGRTTYPRLPAMAATSHLLLGPVLDDRGRALGSNHGSLTVELQEGDGPWKRFLGKIGQPLPVAPGILRVRAKTGETGLAFEGEVVAEPGREAQMAIRLSGAR